MHDHRSRIGGALLGGVAVFAATGASIAASNADGWGNPIVIGLLAAAALCLGSSVWAFGMQTPEAAHNAKIDSLAPRRPSTDDGNTRGDVRAGHDIKAGDDVEASGAIAAGGSIDAGGAIRAGAQTQSPTGDQPLPDAAGLRPSSGLPGPGPTEDRRRNEF